jgi:hypothetical protein
MNSMYTDLHEQCMLQWGALHTRIYFLVIIISISLDCYIHTEQWGAKLLRNFSIIVETKYVLCTHTSWLMCITWTNSSHQRVQLSVKVGLINLLPTLSKQLTSKGKMIAHRSLILSWYSTVLRGDLSVFFWRSLYIYVCRYKYVR